MFYSNTTCRYTTDQLCEKYRKLDSCNQLKNNRVVETSICDTKYIEYHDENTNLIVAIYYINLSTAKFVHTTKTMDKVV